MNDKLPHEKGFHISWDQIHRDSRALAWRLDGKGPDDGAWKAVIAITRGGMAPAMIVARELDIRTVDTISVKSYDHQQQSEAVVLKSPDMNIMGDGSGILIIDDLVDAEEYRRGKKTFHIFVSEKGKQNDSSLNTYQTSSAIYGGNLTTLFGSRVIAKSNFETKQISQALQIYLQGAEYEIY